MYVQNGPRLHCLKPNAKIVRKVLACVCVWANGTKKKRGEQYKKLKGRELFQANVIDSIDIYDGRNRRSALLADPPLLPPSPHTFRRALLRKCTTYHCCCALLSVVAVAANVAGAADYDCCGS